MNWYAKYSAAVPLMYLLFIMLSCNDTHKENSTKAKSAIGQGRLIKPASSYQDTLSVSIPSAVFYYPDSVQLLKYKALIDSNAYKSIDHEFYYQLHYAHIAIQKQWPSVRILECKQHRYIRFNKSDGSNEYVDLDTKGDIYGLFVFDGKKHAEQIDLTNVETQVGFYFQGK